tara:strand:- start:1916 stop:2170 length:255 start_codon:yes stop_codon:yes gene_type:complete
MIIPVRCFTCGKVIGNKYNSYKDLVSKYRLESKKGEDEDMLDVEYVKETQNEDTPECKALNDLKIIRYCCRRHYLSHVDLVDII